jgi:hypothetical protein
MGPIDIPPLCNVYPRDPVHIMNDRFGTRRCQLIVLQYYYCRCNAVERLKWLSQTDFWLEQDRVLSEKYSKMFLAKVGLLAKMTKFRVKNECQPMKMHR